MRLRVTVALFGLTCFLLGVAAAWAPEAGRAFAAWVARKIDGR